MGQVWGLFFFVLKLLLKFLNFKKKLWIWRFLFLDIEGFYFFNDGVRFLFGKGIFSLILNVFINFVDLSIFVIKVLFDFFYIIRLMFLRTWRFLFLSNCNCLLIIWRNSSSNFNNFLLKNYDSVVLNLDYQFSLFKHSEKFIICKNLIDFWLVLYFSGKRAKSKSWDCFWVIVRAWRRSDDQCCFRISS